MSFPSKDMLDEYLARIEEAKKRDHRKLGKELGLFTLMDEGPGFPFFLPKGMSCATRSLTTGVRYTNATAMWRSPRR